MRIVKIIVILICLFVGTNTVYISKADNQDQPVVTPTKIIKIAIISSYGPRHVCGSSQLRGFISKLSQYNFTPHQKLGPITNYYLQTNTINTKESQVNTQVVRIIQELKDNSIDIIVTIDDAAFKYLGAPLSNIGYPVFFSGLNSKLSTYEGLYNPDNVAGVLERIELSKLNILLEKYKSLKENITILTSRDATLVERGFLSNVSEELDKFKIPYTTKRIANKIELITYLGERNKERNPGTYFLIIQRTQDIYKNKYLSKENLYKIINEFNVSNIEIVGNSDSVAAYKMSMSVGPDFNKMGQNTAMLVGLYIESNLKVNSNSIVIPPSIMSVNLKKMKRLGRYDIVIENISLFSDIF